MADENIVFIEEKSNHKDVTTQNWTQKIYDDFSSSIYYLMSYQLDQLKKSEIKDHQKIKELIESLGSVKKTKINIINDILKGNPSWKKLFLKYIIYDHILISTQSLENLVLKIKKNKQALKSINLSKYINDSDLSERDKPGLEFTLLVSEINGEIEKFKKQNFQKKHTKNFNFDIEKNTLDKLWLLHKNNELMLQKAILRQSKNIKNHEELILRVDRLMKSEQQWHASHYLSAFNVVEFKNNQLWVKLETMSQSHLYCPKSWCLQNDKDSLEDRLSGGLEIYMLFDFNKSPDHKMSIIGISLDRKEKKITEAFDLYDQSLFETIDCLDYVKLPSSIKGAIN